MLSDERKKSVEEGDVQDLVIFVAEEGDGKTGFARSTGST
jgi:hypothetical protein